MTEDMGLEKLDKGLLDFAVICSELRLEGSFRLSYNGSMFALEGLGILLTFEHLVDCSENSGLVFRPLDPVKESSFYLIWSKYQTFTPIAERFLSQITQSFSEK